MNLLHTYHGNLYTKHDYQIIINLVIVSDYLKSEWLSGTKRLHSVLYNNIYYIYILLHYIYILCVALYTYNSEARPNAIHLKQNLVAPVSVGNNRLAALTYITS